MAFNSFTFLVFFPCVYLAYALTMRRLRLQNTLLLVASYLFYGWWAWQFLSLIALSTVVDFMCSRLLDQQRSIANQTDTPNYALSPGRRKTVMWISVAFNLGLLGVFKYFDFFVGEFASLLGAVGFGWQPRLLDVVLPVGISFYTFQTMSYTIDVYRGKIRAEQSLLNFALFVSFFPQLVAGPITRASELLPQIAQRRRLDHNQIYDGCYLILWGLFKKVVIADGLAVMVDKVFAPGIALNGGGQVLVTVYAFAIQIYCDFSGYTDIGRGCAKMLGFELPLNFKLPYFATSPRDFWRRWHITLSQWLRDYVYIPLGGNRSGPRRTCINLMITMVLGGLWHGSAWTFVIWGAFHGMLLIVDHLLYEPISRAVRRMPTLAQRAMPWIARIACFHLICFGWLLFRADSMSQVLHMMDELCTAWPWWIIMGAHTLTATGIIALVSYSLPLLIIQSDQFRRDNLNVVSTLPAWARGVCYAVLFYGVVLWGGQASRGFIYFQF